MSGDVGQPDQQQVGNNINETESTDTNSRKPEKGGRQGNTFRVRAFRLYFIGQLISNTGSWFQNLTISLLVLQSTGSATSLAWVTIAQFAPIFLLSPFAGWLSDRFPVRRILLATASGSVAVSLSLVAMFGDGSWELQSLLWLLAFAGAFQGLERIAAQTFIYELVGPDRLKQGTVLASTYTSTARFIGPGLAGLAYAALGPVPCLIINAGSYAAVVTALLMIRPAELFARTEKGAPRIKIRFRELPNFHLLVILLIINSLVTIAAMNMNIVLTALVTETHGGGAEHLGLTHTLNAIGSVAGAFILARYRALSFRTLTPALAVFAVALALNAAAPTLLFLLLMAPVLGLGIGLFHGVINASAQSMVPPATIGRMMSLVTLGSFGSIPVGALFAGWLIDVAGARMPFFVGAAVCVVGAMVVLILGVLASRRKQVK